EAVVGVVVAAQQAAHLNGIGGADEQRWDRPVLVVEEVVEVVEEAARGLGRAPAPVLLDGEDGGVDAAAVEGLGLERIDLGGRAVAAGEGAGGPGAVEGGAVAAGGQLGLGPREVGVEREDAEGLRLLARGAVAAGLCEGGEGGVEAA